MVAVESDRLDSGKEILRRVELAVSRWKDPLRTDSVACVPGRPQLGLIDDAMEQERQQRFMAAVGPVLARLYRIARVLCGDADLAQDLTQDTLLRGLQAFGTFEAGSPLLPWLARIMRNVFVNHTKSGRIKYEVCDEEAVSAAWAPEQPGALALLERAQLIQCLRDEIGRLPRPFHLVVLLCDQDGMSYEDAAEVAGVPVGTVRSRLARARAELRTRVLARLEHPQAEGNSERLPLVLLAEAGRREP